MTSWFRRLLKRGEQGVGFPEEEQALTSGEEEEGQLALDVYQDKDNVIVKSTIAGVRPEDLDITLSNEMVTIRGARKREEEVQDQDYFYQECYWGSFSRSLALPVEVDADKAEAEMKDGILTIVLPKAARTRAKKVKVRGEG
jgi:HSP20 family protein